MRGHQHAERQLALDGLRGLSCLAIAMYHVYPGARPLFWAWTLVDLFFVLSGFLIGRILYQGLVSQTLSMRHFFIRRALRIWPVYFLALMAALLLFCGGVWSNDAMGGISTWTSWLFLQFTDFYLKPGADWEASLAQYIPWFSQSWSIAAEEQFYLLLPLLLMLGGATRRCFLLLATMAYVTSFVMRQQGFALGLLGTRLDGFALGLVMVVLWIGVREAPTRVQQRRAEWIATLAQGLALVAALSLAGPVFVRAVGGMLDGVPAHFEYADQLRFLQGMALAYFVLVAHVLLLPAAWLPRLLASPLLVHLGALSYAIYMFHPILQGVFLRLAQAPEMREAPWWTQAAYWAALWLVAFACSRTVERFFNALKDRYPLVAKRPEPAYSGA